MKSTKAAARYAKALLELAIEQNKLDQISNDMRYLAEVNAESRDFQTLLNSPIVNTAKKKAILKEVFGEFEETTRLFVNLITDNRREAMLPAIAVSFEALVKAHKGIVPVTLISPVQLSEKAKSKILAEVSKTVKGELEVNEVIDKSLIGGFIVRMDDMQVDASIASQFINLKQRLTR